MFILIIALLCGAHGERQRYDGWYNNLANPSWGSIGDNVVYRSPPAYSDLTYHPSGEDRPNPRLISEQVLSGPSGLPSYLNRTTLFAFFGQMVAYEIVHASDTSCPVELLRIPVPREDKQFQHNASSQQYFPFLRSDYNRETGQSPNRPRQPINKASSWIDGNFIYGRGEVWSNALRSFTGGRLASQRPLDPSTIASGRGSKEAVSSEDQASGPGAMYPAYNLVRLPLDNYPSPTTQTVTKPEEQWLVGDPHAHQNPGLLTLAVVWFRYHNVIADRLHRENPRWKDDRIFHAARRHVIAALQNIIMYEWLPALLNENITEYRGYNNNIQPSIDAMFEAAAFRVGHSFVPPGFYIRNKTCHYKRTDNNGAGIRLCNSYWNSQTILERYGIDDFLLGMTSQLCEREDHVIVNDLRGNVFGPLHYTRHDLAVMTIMRGRDHGLPDYNTVRAAYNLTPITDWADINPRLFGLQPEVIKRLKEVYNGSISTLDPYPAGLLESTPDSLGPLFTTVIRDQFLRIRDSDRLWFENTENHLYSKDEIVAFKRLKFKDILTASTLIGMKDVQSEVFFWKQGDPCPQPKQLEEGDLEECSPHRGFDYFAGSEVSYITAFTSLALLPFLCIMIAVAIARLKRMRIARAQHKILLRDFVAALADNSRIKSDTFQVLEWRSKKKELRSITLRLNTAQSTLTVLSSSSGSSVPLRVVNLSRTANILLWTSSDKERNHLLLHVPKEYDLVVRFIDERRRLEFIAALREALKSSDKSVLLHDCQTKEMFERAVTKEKRQQMLASFFRSVFAEANDVHEIRHSDDIELHQCREIVNCELTRAEFAEALSIKPDSLFVTQMFSVIDRDENGYISFRELLHAVLLFAKGSCEDKLHVLFRMYDRDESGTLCRVEVTEMIRSIMEMANTSLSVTEIDGLVNEMFIKSGLEGRDSLTFTDFTRLLGEHMDLLWNVCIDWKGTKVCLPKMSAHESKKQKIKKITGATTSVPAVSSHQLQGEGDEALCSVTRRPLTKRATLTISKRMLFIRDFTRYVENRKQQAVYLFLFFAICILLFGERFYKYAVEYEHRGLRSITGYGLSLTRGAAAGMSFTFSLLLLTMCRNTITCLRDTVLNLYVPFDSYVELHKIVAYTALFFTVIHIVGYCFNFYHVATQPVEFLCIFDEVYFRSDFLPKVYFWLFQTIPGVLLVIIVCIIYVFATSLARQHIFNAFWITHQLFYVLYVVTLLHGSVRLVQDPFFPYYFVGPAALFTLDKLISLSRTKRELSITRVELLPSDVTLVEFRRPSNFEYLSGQWIRLACGPLGAHEYHALTLTSAPHEDTLSVHIRAIGPWTTNLRRILDQSQHQPDLAYPKVYVDGPFGAGQQDWISYDVSVLVGGGIGVTPYAAILKDFVFLTSVKNSFKMKCKKVYFMWVTASQKHFEWLIDIIRSVEEVDERCAVETHIFITQLFSRFDLRTTMLYICEEHFQRMSNRSVFTGLKARTHFGRPDFEKILHAIHSKHPRVRKIGVFSCGPPSLTKSVQGACHESSKSTKARFDHHFENF